MTTPSSVLPRSSRPKLLRGAAVLATVLVLASCGAKGKDSLTSKDMIPALPKSVGDGYKKKTEDLTDKAEGKDKSDKASDAAMEKACPEAAKLDGDSEDSGDKVSREFEDENGRGITITVDPSPKDLAADEIDSFIKAINKCDEIEFDNDGSAVTMTIEAEREDSYGDAGVRFKIHGSVEVAGVGEIPIELEGVQFVLGAVSGSVETVSGLDRTYSMVPPETDKIDDLAADLEQKLEEIAG